MRQTRDCSWQGILLRKVVYRNSSLLLDIITPQAGKITILAKGVRNPNNHFLSILEVGNELDILIQKSTTDLYYFKQAELIHAYFHGIAYEPSLPYYAAVELYLQLSFPEEEALLFYQLLKEYFTYMKKVSINGIAIFWRFFLRLFHLYGIPIDFSKCCHCHSTLSGYKAYLPSMNGFLCDNCLTHKWTDVIFFVNGENDALKKMNHIGNCLNQLILTDQTIRSINSLLLNHMSEHFHKPFHLKSLQSIRHE
jgi:DNA repair protein RecO